MKRWTLALAVLLGGTLSFAYGDYVILLYNVGAAKTTPTDPKSGTGPVAGGGPTRPGFGQMGGMIGGAPPGAGGGSGRGPMGPGLGAAGGIAGAGAAGGYGPTPPKGAGGGAGGPFMPGTGSGRMGSGGGMFPGAGELGGQGGSSESEGSPLYVRAVVEVGVTNIDGKRINKGNQGWVRHKWGMTCLMDQDNTFLAAVVHHDSVMKVYENKKKDLTKGGDKPPIEAVLELADWTLSHGLIEQYQAAMKLAEDVDPKNAAVQSFKQIDADLKKEVRANDFSGEWKESVLQKIYVFTSSEHYSLFYQTKESTPAEVKSRLAHLENQLKLFYYWFAKQGQILPMPQQRLVAILVPHENEFERQQKVFETTPLVDDGFYARRENLVVLSQMRIDTPYLALRKHDEILWTEWGLDRDQMLKGKVPSKQKLSKFGENAGDKVAEAQTMALLEKALEQDAELAAISHDGTRQLIASAGLTTPGVVVPEWIQFGMGSFFETPKGAPWTTVGKAHWDYLPVFLDLDKEKKLDKPAELLKGIVTDRYFRSAIDPKKSKPQDEPEMKARSLSWALTYYLAHNKLDGLLRYYRELSKLPRDIEFDDEVLLGCFGRAFELMDAAGKKVDENKLAAFADIWYRQMVRFTAGEASDLLAELKKNREEAMQAKPTEKVNPFNPPGGVGGGNAP